MDGRRAGARLKTLAVVGPSESGKTTLLVRVIEELVARGVRVGAIKHTHHPLTDVDRGDTRRFRAAGAERAILAGDGEAVLFEAGRAERLHFSDPQELLAYFDADAVVVEGFRSATAWPRLAMPVSLDEALRMLAP